MVAPSKPFTVIPDGDIDPDSPCTTQLFVSLRDNDIHNEEWIGDSFTAAKDHDHDGLNSATVAGTLALVEEKEHTGASVSSLTFSGLNGNVDDVYLLIARVRGDGSTGGAGIDRDIYLNPNAITTGGSTISATGGFAGSATRIALANWTGTTARFIQFSTWFYANNLVGSFASNRHALTQTGHISDTDSLFHRWADNTTNITSLEIQLFKVGIGAAAEIATGTSMALYKLRG